MDILLTGLNAAGKQAQPSGATGVRTPPQPGGTPDIVRDATQPKTPKEQMSDAQRNDAVKNFKKSVESLASTNLKFSIDKDIDKLVIKVVDKETGDTIRQIPSEEIIALDKAMARNQGMLLHDKA